MPRRLVLCSSPTCSGYAMPGRNTCELHTPVRMPDTRPSAARRGYDQKWRRIRAQFLRLHPICVSCGGPANEVDHIVPLAAGGTHAHSNLQSMCKSCHSSKTGRFDRGGRGDQKSGIDAAIDRGYRQTSSVPKIGGVGYE